MKAKYLNGILVLFILSIISLFLYAQDNWTMELAKEGITVYTRPVEGSPLKEFKGEGMVSAPLEVCENVMSDIESQTKWRPDCIEAALIKREGNVDITYTQTKAPWPVSNRDVIVKSVITKKKDKIEYSFTAVDDPSLKPVPKGVVRMTKVSGYWLLLRKGNETFVTYQAKIDPAGSIPAWLANKTSIEQPFESIKGMRKMVKDTKYHTK